MLQESLYKISTRHETSKLSSLNGISTTNGVSGAHTPPTSAVLVSETTDGGHEQLGATETAPWQRAQVLGVAESLPAVAAHQSDKGGDGADARALGQRGLPLGYGAAGSEHFGGSVDMANWRAAAWSGQRWIEGDGARSIEQSTMDSTHF
jgi:hypothetical protein